MRILTAYSAILLISCLQSCGWQLRGMHSQSLPEQLSFSSVDRLSPFSAVLAENLRNLGIRSEQTASIKLLIGEEKLQKRTVAVTNIGTAAQYEIRLTIPYRYTFRGDSSPTLKTDMTSAFAVRIFDFETGTNLSRAREENLLLNEMRSEIATHIIQQSRLYVHGKN